MNKQREARLEELDRKVQVPWNSLKDKDILIKELEEISATESQERFSFEELNKVSLITVSLFTRNYEFVGKVANGERQLNDDELKGLEKSFNGLPKTVEKFKEQAEVYESVGLKSAADSHRGISKIAEGEDYKSVLNKAIQKEKARRQSPPNQLPPPNRRDEPNDDNSPPPKSSELDKKISGLKSQIKVLEDKVKNSPNSDPDAVKQNKQKIQELQQQLKEKEKEKEKGEKSPKKNDFPTALVVGGVAIVSLLLLIVIILLIKNNKNK